MAGITLRPLTFIFFILETLFILAAEIIAFELRFKISSWELSAFPYLVPRMLLVAFVTQLCLYYQDLYRFDRLQQLHQLALKILQGIGVATIVLMGIYYVFPHLFVGRGLLGLAMLHIFAVVMLWRYVLHAFSRKGGALATQTLILGSGAPATKLIEYISDSNHCAYKLVGFLEEDSKHLGPVTAVSRVVGSYRNLYETAVKEKVDLIIVALDDRRGCLPVEGLAECKLHGITILDTAKFLELEHGVISLLNLHPSWLIFSDGFRPSRSTLLLKDIIEVSAAFALLAITMPIMLLIALAIRMESPGPILFRQSRTGERGRLFTLLKFRSMWMDAESDGVARWATEGDPRVTRVGRFLRKYRLDELPQLLNVVSREMSLIGPRPERPEFVDQLRKKIPCYAQRLAVRPGMSGLAQVRDRYGSSVEDAARKLEYDLYYVKHLSLFLDLSIWVDTLKVVLVGQGSR